MPGPTPSFCVFLLLMVPVLSDRFDINAIDMCERGHVKIDGSCFTFGPKDKDWNEANAICMAKGMALARINTQEKHDALNEYMSKVFTIHEWFWIDLKRSTTGFVHVPDMRELNQSFWNPGEPNNKNDQCVIKKVFGWSDVSCNFKVSFLCESQECPPGCKDEAKVSVSPENNVDIVHCRNGAKKLGDTCYFIESSRSVTWDDARADCLQDSSKMALMNTDKKYIQLDDYLKTLPFAAWKPFWIAPRRAVGTDDFYDGRNEVTGTRWAKGEPNNYRGSEDCAMYMYWPQATDFKWNDANCGTTAGFICELKECPEVCEVEENSNKDPVQIDPTIEKKGSTSSVANITESQGNVNSEVVKESTQRTQSSSYPTKTVKTPADSAGSSAKALFSMVVTLATMACMKI